MRFKHIISLILVLIIAGACSQGTVFADKDSEKLSVKLMSPKKGAVVNISNPLVKNWWKNYTLFSAAKYKKVKERAKPRPVALKWKGGKGYVYKLRLSTSKSLKNSRVFRTKKTSKKLYNLLRNQKYYWQVSAKKGKVTVRSKIGSFKTNNQPRVIRAPFVSNIRDIGGYKTSDGKVTQQGRVFRSGDIDAIEKSGRKILDEELGIITDLDLRRSDEGDAGDGSPALDNYYHLRGSKYEEIFEDGKRRERFIEGVKVFAEPQNYPILVHCAYGRDRTGTLVFVLNGLLGVGKKDLYRDYELSFLTSKGSRRAKQFISEFDSFYKKMRSYSDRTKPLSYNIEQYLLDSGVTEEEIAGIKEMLL